MLKRKKALVTLDPNCLNCGYPFTKNEKFCPECGQKNKGSKITFGSFTREMFRGFFSWDAKFWSTLVPLMIKPGKVSKNYIAGQRNRLQLRVQSQIYTEFPFNFCEYAKNHFLSLI